MSAPDLRKPSLVTEDFRARLAWLLEPLGFSPRARGKVLLRKRGKNTHRIEFGSSHRNAPGYAVCWPALFFEDAATRQLVSTWRAGGLLDGPAFALESPRNVANTEDAAALATIVVERLEFFEWLEKPEDVLAEVRRRYVPGLVEPAEIAPYLRAHLGPDAVREYAAALLAGRPELAPAYVTELADGQGAIGRTDHADHGTRLARAMLSFGSGGIALPPDVVGSDTPAARNLRCFFGRQLRAFGEPEAAAELRHVPDAEVLRVRAAQEALHEPVVDSVAAARLVLALATGVDRPPRHEVPRPRLFQYHARHGVFGPPALEQAYRPRP